MIYKGVWDKEYIWSPSNCECKCDKTCDVGKYLDYKNRKCTKSLADKLVEACTKNIDEVKVASENEHRKRCSCILCCFQYYLQSTLESLLILFTTNTWIVIKEMFLNIIISIRQKNTNINLKY